MSFIEFMTPDKVACRIPVTSKKQVLQQMADQAAAQCCLSSRTIFDAIMKREKLGNTGIGAGYAIPHAVIDGLERDLVILATLATPVNFDASDGKTVDIICLVLGPTGANSGHLATVSMASRLLKAKGAVMRQAHSKDDLIMCLYPDKTGTTVAA